VARYFIELAYDGTDYNGWQHQTNAERTVQDEIDKALSLVLQSNIRTTGSSRTDTGVHAEQSYAHFDTDVELKPDLLRNLNFLLPKDVVVKKIIPVSTKAHSRFDAVGRYYEYCICYDKNPFVSRFTTFYPYKPLDVDKLNEAADIFRQHKNFRAFSKKHTNVVTYECTIHQAVWEWDDEARLLMFKVKANRFLRGMVRALVQTSIRFARGKLSKDHLLKLLQSGDAHKTDFAAPAQGLTLKAVIFPPGYFDAQRDSQTL
jgi:tRNA pseudouridine38-40 synthase